MWTINYSMVASCSAFDQWGSRVTSTIRFLKPLLLVTPRNLTSKILFLEIPHTSVISHCEGLGDQASPDLEALSLLAFIVIELSTSWRIKLPITFTLPELSYWTLWTTIMTTSPMVLLRHKFVKVANHHLVKSQFCSTKQSPYLVPWPDQELVAR